MAAKFRSYVLCITKNSIRLGIFHVIILEIEFYFRGEFIEVSSFNSIIWLWNDVGKIGDIHKLIFDLTSNSNCFDSRIEKLIGNSIE